MNISYVRNLSGLAVALKSLTTSALDVDDLFRMCLVQIVSALDKYFHDMVLYLMVNTYGAWRNGSEGGAKFLKFDIDMETHLALLSLGEEDALLRFASFIESRNSWRSFQHPDKIKDAFSVVFVGDLWANVGEVLSMEKGIVKGRLISIVDRRNKISHEADLDPSYDYTSRWPIELSLVTESIDFIDNLIKAFDSVLAGDD